MHLTNSFFFSWIQHFLSNLLIWATQGFFHAGSKINKKVNTTVYPQNIPDYLLKSEKIQVYLRLNSEVEIVRYSVDIFKVVQEWQFIMIQINKSVLIVIYKHVGCHRIKKIIFFFRNTCAFFVTYRFFI